MSGGGREGWNPRYVAYATAHKKTPEEMQAHDREMWPGGCAVGFMLWMSGRWEAFHRFALETCLIPKGTSRYDIGAAVPNCYRIFDEWLKENLG